MAALELKVPPVAVVLLAGLGMWLAARAAPGLAFSWPYRRATAASVAGMGLALAVAGVVSFARARTTVDPMKPGEARALVTSGIYRVTRNPMYLGMLLALAGWVAWLGNAAALPALPMFVLYMNRFQIEPEERALAARFGAAVSTYRRRVRRWI